MIILTSLASNALPLVKNVQARVFAHNAQPLCLEFLILTQKNVCAKMGIMKMQIRIARNATSLA